MFDSSIATETFQLLSCEKTPPSDASSRVIIGFMLRFQVFMTATLLLCPSVATINKKQKAQKRVLFTGEGSR